MFIWTISDNCFSFLTIIFSARSKHYLPSRQARVLPRQAMYGNLILSKHIFQGNGCCWSKQAGKPNRHAKLTARDLQAMQLFHQIYYIGWKKLVTNFGIVSLFILWSEAFARILRHFIICLERNFNYCCCCLLHLHEHGS